MVLSSQREYKRESYEEEYGKGEWAKKRGLSDEMAGMEAAKL
jgi:hypothetical protein